MAGDRGLFLLVVLCLGLKTAYCYTVCPEGYCRHANDCYLVVGLKVSWIDAKSYCKTLGGSLLSISSSTMNSAAEGALRRSLGLTSLGIFWLDITDLLNPKDWREMKSRTALSYANWDSNPFQGNGTDDKHCVAMSEANGYKWTPEHCGKKLNFVCFSSGTQSYNRNYYQRQQDDDDQIEC